MKHLLAVLLLLGCAGAAYGQLRTIPEDAKRGVMRHVHGMVVEIDGAPQRLAAGAQIRSASNMIVVPNAIPPGTLVKYRLDGQGMVRQVWFLTPQEAAQTDKVK
jgi:hypothetical protein